MASFQPLNIQLKMESFGIPTLEMGKFVGFQSGHKERCQNVWTSATRFLVYSIDFSSKSFQVY